MSRDVRKLIGRVYPVVQRFSAYAGRSTVGDELSPQDVAAAVGMVPSGLGRNLFLYLWWREAADEPQLKQDLAVALFNEWSTRKVKHALLSVELASAIADKEPTRAETLRSAVWSARKRCWPRCRWMYRRLVDVVLVDLAHNEICDWCLGELDDCEKCKGHGVTKFTVTRRADLLGVCRATYRNSWSAAYDWLFAKCLSEEHRVTTQVARRLLNR